MNIIIKIITLLGMLSTVAWFFWNPEGWVFEWEPIVVFLFALAGYVGSEVGSNKLDHQEKPAANPNDEKLFSKLLDALPSTEVMSFVDKHDFLGDFKNETLRPVYRFFSEWDNSEHEFIDETLESLRKDLLNKIKTFNLVIAKYTAPNNRGFQAVRVDTQKGDPEHEARFAEEATIINNSANELYASHQLLIREARLSLEI
ncbi:MAG: hypothetical protein ACI8RO_000580 [Flavobacteriales bacterium]|jgi:hypothetical protein